jgi:hypothetical protein
MMSRPSIRRTSVGMLAATIPLIALAITSQPAHAAATRAEYVAQVDPICQRAQSPTVKALFALGKAIVKKVGGSDRLEALTKHPNQFFKQVSGPYAKWLGRVNRIYARETGQIAAIAPAPGDEATVAMWLQQRAAASSLAIRAKRSIRQKKVRRFLRLTGQTEKTSRIAGQTVGDFGFIYCAQPLGNPVIQSG